MSLHKTLDDKRIHFLKKVSEDVAPYYSDIPYHNINHAIDVSLHIIDIAKEMGYEGDINTLIYAGMWHDAGYALDQAKEFETKEDFSIFLREKWAKNNDIDNKVIEKCSSIIDATKIYNVDFSTIEKKIIRAADIRTIGYNYDYFYKDAIKIKQEYEQINDVQLSIKVFLKKHIEMLQYLINQKDLVEERYFIYKDSNFYESAQRNINQLKKEIYITTPSTSILAHPTILDLYHLVSGT